MNQNLEEENNEVLLKKLIEELASSWPQSMRWGDDPNTHDIWYHASKIVDTLRLKLPTTLPDVKIGILLVDCVGKDFSYGLIREVPPKELAGRGISLLRNLENQHLLPYKPIENYVISLYIYHGYFCISKMTRVFYNTPSGKIDYTDEVRIKLYANLQKLWETEEVGRGNPWVRYGVTIAKPFDEKNRKNEDIINNWIPRDSPYWNSVKS